MAKVLDESWGSPRRGVGAVLLACVLLGGGGRLEAQPLPVDRVPEPLRPWAEWVRRDVEARLRCTFVEGRSDETFCAWAGPLALAVERGGARFEQTWRMEMAGWAPLPGSELLRPLGVQVDGRPAVVVLREGTPQVRLGPGPHRVQGRLTWARRPAFLPVPPLTGIVRLTLDGRPLPEARREPDGALWLSGRGEAGGAEGDRDALRLVVHRRIEDDVPLLVETRIRLQVAGRSREQRLAPVLLPGTEPLRIETPLPARFDGEALRVQVRPGTWELRVVARRSERVEALQLPRARSEGWPEQEVWVLSPHPEHREIELQGVPPVDPEQTLLPEAWRGMRAFRVEAGARVRLVQRRRGREGHSEAEAIALQREVWLDFDGRGATVRDVLRGVSGEAHRMEVRPFLRLQRVLIDGRPQLVTRLGRGAVGVEVRKREITLTAEGRLEGLSWSALPVAGWSFDPKGVEMTLHLPPGWHPWAVFGADEVSPREAVWLDSWDLFEMFVLLLLAVAAWRLWGPTAAVLTFVVVLLTHPVGLHAAWWVPWFVLEAIRRALPAGPFRRIFGWAEGSWVVLVLLVSLGFGVDQVRASLHPALEPHNGEGAQMPEPLGGALPAEPEAPTGRRSSPALRGSEELRSLEALAGQGGGGETSDARGKYVAAQTLAYEVDPEAAVQTGPGLPTWRWREVRMAWRGPISSSHRVRLLLSPPWLSSLVGFVRVLLLGMLLGWLVRRSLHLGASSARGGASSASALVLVGLVLPALLPGRTSAQPVSPSAPPPPLLEELKERLGAPPACSPTCAELQRLDLELLPSRFTLALRFGALARTAVPLPLRLEQWQPERVLLDGRQTEGLVRDEGGRLWLRLPEGIHDVRLAGPAPEAAQVQFPLPMRPASMAHHLEGWDLTGFGTEGGPSGTLTAVRRLTVPEAGAEPSTSSTRIAVPPFVRVHRTLSLGLQWTVRTRLERLSPEGSSLLLRIPALPGERPTDETVRLEGDNLHVQVPAEANSLQWESVLAPRAELVLQAARSPRFVEVWEVEASPVWHVRYEGPPSLHQQADEAPRRWKPWPGETLRIRVQRPDPAEGPTTTVERAALEVRPGRRATDASLELSVRSSRGGPFRIRLAPDAQVGSLRIGGEEVPVRFVRGILTVALAPGLSAIALDWREPRAVALAFRVPRVRLEGSAVNVSTTVRPDASRWVLWTSGPRLGPAVLFWGVLLVLFVVAVLLGRWRRTGLGVASWSLLLVGLSQVPVWAAAVVVGWLLYVRPGREGSPPAGPGGWRRLARALLVAPWTLVALVVLLYAVHRGLLGSPQMQIEGHGSWADQLVWYVDRVVPGRGQHSTLLSDAAFYSVPMLVYRGLMLLWALWLAFALLGWLRVAWGRFSEEGSWGWLRPARPSAPRSPEPSAPDDGAVPRRAPPDPSGAGEADSSSEDASMGHAQGQADAESDPDGEVTGPQEPEGDAS